MKFTALVAADFNSAQLTQLLAAERALDGVVFEIMAREDNSWDWAAPLLHSYVDQLHRKYPDHDVAVSGSAQLADYSRLGFETIKLEPPHGTD